MLHHTPLTLLLATLLFILQASASISTQNVFVTPPSPGPKFNFEHNLNYPLGTPFTVTWNTTYNKLSLILWQYGNSTNQVLLDSVDTRTSWPWTVNLDGLYSLSGGNGKCNLLVWPAVLELCGPLSDLVMLVFSFQIIDESSDKDQTITKNQFASHEFNISDPNASQSSSASVSTSSTSTSGSTASSSPASSSSTGLSTGAKVGIGVGAGLGALFVAAIVAFFCFRRRVHKSRQQHHANTNLHYSHSHSQIPGRVPMQQAMYSPQGVPLMNGMPPHPQQQPKSPQELPEQNGFVELGARPGGQERQELPGDLEGRGPVGESVKRN